MQQSPTPVRHHELAETLRQELASGAYQVGQRYPTEHELQARYGVGRHTIREALKILTEQGLLGRRRKTGTVVLALKPLSTYVHTLRDVGGLFDFAQTTDLQVGHVGFVTHPRILPADLAGGPDRRWLRIAGIRHRKGQAEPLCWAEILVPERFAPSREAIRVTGRAVYEAVVEEHGLTFGHVEQDISAAELPEGLAAQLGTEPGRAALVVRRRYVTQQGVTFEVSQNTYPADRYSVSSIIRKRA